MEQDPTKAVRQHQDDTARLGDGQAARVHLWQKEYGGDMTKPTKTCTTCKHYRSGSFWSTHLARCAAYTDPVSGGPGAFCDIEREGSGYRTGCGSQGRRWEGASPRAPWWAFWRYG